MDPILCPEAWSVPKSTAADQAPDCAEEKVQLSLQVSGLSGVEAVVAAGRHSWRSRPTGRSRPRLVSCLRGSALHPANAGKFEFHAAYFRDTTLGARPER